ncbi:MAG TPA: lanthionine synthetase LanC family protein, partial [Blastocatellia bacterium]|nr:lanthionine synthetase LanC family protein [Blastocatellia bacterium]
MRTFIAPLVLLGILSSNLPAADTSYRDAALEAARWIRASAARADQGTVWPSDPRDAKSVNDTLYAGTPGVILFFLEASRSTGDQSFLKNACAGADHLLATFANEKESGLYVGIAGIGFALTETFKASGESKYRQGALRCAQLLGERTKKVGNGIEWNDT